MVGTSYDATMALFGAVCAFGGALAYAAWSGALDLYRSDVETRQRWSSTRSWSRWSGFRSGKSYIVKMMVRYLEWIGIPTKIFNVGTCGGKRRLPRPGSRGGVAGLLERVSEYEKRYETIEDDEGDGSVSYIKIIDVGEKMVARKCSGYLTSQISFFGQHPHHPAKIWLALHAETLEETRCGVRGITAGGGLTEYGSRFAVELARFVRAEHAAFQQQQALDHQGGGGLLVLTGNAQRRDVPRLRFSTSSAAVISTASPWRTRGEIPGVWKARNADKLRFRYPGAGGESYVDLITRLRPILIELERQRRNVLLVSHLAVQRCLYAYFVGTPAAEIPYIKLPTAPSSRSTRPLTARLRPRTCSSTNLATRSMQHCVSSVGDLVHKFAEVPPSADGFVR
ncbi:hypothetical protein CTAYLR_004765 [Chrysophaeum taylorii]|uniref:6-phosphofructo-2-kinase domain-containing protein n=1 Tax=Chrysophaeum taylorii TaxID=2483200 RepID=A0AAD7U990_9STRA|nr:hypothetical protein CTAYLR_004765 [Chrysophaeum taylorii]